MTDLPLPLCQRETLQWKATGELLFQEGSDPCGVWLLHSGKVDLLFSTPQGDPRPLRTADAPQIIGASAVLAGSPHDCSAVTHTECLIGFIDKESFLTMISEDPSARFTVLQAQCDEINSCYDCLRVIFGSAPQRAGRPKYHVEPIVYA